MNINGNKSLDSNELFKNKLQDYKKEGKIYKEYFWIKTVIVYIIILKLGCINVRSNDLLKPSPRLICLFNLLAYLSLMIDSCIQH